VFGIIAPLRHCDNRDFLIFGLVKAVQIIGEARPLQAGSAGPSTLR
jgi:hypothetical protein